MRSPELEDVTVAALWMQPFTLYLLVLRFVAPPSDAAWAHADPILTLVPGRAALWLAPLSGVVLAAVWWRIARPSAAAFRTGWHNALFGALLAAVAVGALRLATGPVMPPYIPPEESAAPGFLASMSAGYWEEVVCRLGVLPLAYFFLRGRAPPWTAAALSVVATGLVFAGWHALGEPFSATFFVTRLVIPGAAMSLVWLWSPSAVIVAHCTAHLLIPALFAAPPG